MTNNTYLQFGQMIGHVLRGEKCRAKDYNWEALLQLAYRQNVAPILYAAVVDNGSSVFSDEAWEKLKRKRAQLLALSERQAWTITQIQSEFEKQGIDNLMLKGSVTRYHYPNPALRTMGDIDFLYRIADHEKVKTALGGLGFTDFEAGRKNDIYRKKLNLVIEAHRSLVGTSSPFYSWASGIWERCRCKKDMAHAYEMTLEDEIIFQVVHFAIHFLEGGAGIRFLSDLYLYSRMTFDAAYVEKELDALSLLTFYRQMKGLAEYWFVSGEYSKIYDELMDYIMGGGVFGSSGNSSALAVEHGRTRYLLRMAFPRYKDMVSVYPKLQGKPLLLPFAWIARGVDKRKKIKGQVRKAKRGDRARAKEIRELYMKCGLDMQLEK